MYFYQIIVSLLKAFCHISLAHQRKLAFCCVVFGGRGVGAGGVGGRGVLFLLMYQLMPLIISFQCSLFIVLIG